MQDSERSLYTICLICLVTWEYKQDLPGSVGINSGSFKIQPVLRVIAYPTVLHCTEFLWNAETSDHSERCANNAFAVLLTTFFKIFFLFGWGFIMDKTKIISPKFLISKIVMKVFCLGRKWLLEFQIKCFYSQIFPSLES